MYYIWGCYLAWQKQAGVLATASLDTIAAKTVIDDEMPNLKIFEIWTTKFFFEIDLDEWHSNYKELWYKGSSRMFNGHYLNKMRLVLLVIISISFSSSLPKKDHHYYESKMMSSIRRLNTCSLLMSGFAPIQAFYLKHIKRLGKTVHLTIED